MLCVISRPPYHDSHSLELIDTALVAAVFEFKVSILFRDDGVWGLLRAQDASALLQRTFSKVLGALETYDIDSIYVCATSMDERALSVADFALPAVALDYDAQTELIAAQDAVIGAQA